MTESKVRLLDQEPDCIAIVPEHPDYVIIGTYSLVKDSTNTSSATQRRKGSVDVIPFDKAQASEVQLARLDFDFGIYDLQFHPIWRNELGMATSHGEMWFYRVKAEYDTRHEKLKSLSLELTWQVPVEPLHPYTGTVPIITQFSFLNLDEGATPILAATSSFGKTRLVKAPVGGHNPILSQNKLIHANRESIEAWATTTVIDQENKKIYVISGDDISQLLISAVEANTISDTNAQIDVSALDSVLLFTNKRLHEAGIVSITNIGKHPILPAEQTSKWANASGTLILTGSYDEHIRLFLFATPTNAEPMVKFEKLAELNLGGGVWRIISLDQYTTHEGNEHEYILLIAGHFGGALIVRLSISRDDARDSDWEYDFHIEKRFEGHGEEGLVYAVAGKQDKINARKWDVISASFYDKKICNWDWIDEEKPKALVEGP